MAKTTSTKKPQAAARATNQKADVTKTDVKAKITKLARFIPWLLVIGGFIGLFCAFMISYDEWRLSLNHNFVPSCNLNPIISCGSVMQSKQAHLFGFPNPFIGLMAFPVLITMGMAMFAGAKFKRWFWLGLETASSLALVFVHWLFFETVYRIHALCPYCMGAWVVTITTFWYVTLYNMETGVIDMSTPSRAKFAAMLRRHHLDILVLWFLVIAGLILKHFWYYYGKHL